MRKLGHIFKKQGGWTAAAIVAAGAIGAAGSKSAADKSASSARKARKESAALTRPYVEAGYDALSGVQSFVNEGAEFSNTQAYKDIVNSAKAGGMNMSGNRLTALTDYYATNFRPQRMNELSYLTTLGANAATNQATQSANLTMAAGNAQAAGALGMANSASSALNNLAFLNAWKGQGGSTAGG